MLFQKKSLYIIKKAPFKEIQNNKSPTFLPYLNLKMP